MEKPTYELHDIYRALDVLGQEDGDGIPLAFSLFPENTNEQKSLKPLEQKVIGEFGCQKFIYCSDAGLASEDKAWALSKVGSKEFPMTYSQKSK